MSATLVSGWGGAAVGSGLPSTAAAGSSRAAARRLIPSVDRTEHQRLLRWRQQGQQSSRVDGAGRRQWRVEAMKKALSVSSESQFEAEVLKSSVPVLVDFWASWCGPCRLMGLTLDWAAQQYDGKVKCVKIETDANEGLVEKYDVYGLPTLILFVNGEVVPNTHREGALTKERLQAYLETNLPTLATST